MGLSDLQLSRPCDLVVKIRHGLNGESYRHRVDDAKKLTMERLRAMVSTCAHSRSASFRYKDSDGDDISIKTEEDLFEAIVVMSEKKSTTLDLQLVHVDEEPVVPRSQRSNGSGGSMVAAIAAGKTLKESVGQKTPATVSKVDLLRAIRKGKTADQFFLQNSLKIRCRAPENDSGRKAGGLLAEIKDGKNVLRANKKSTISATTHDRHSLLRDIQTSQIGSPVSPKSPPPPHDVEHASMAKLSALLGVLSAEAPSVLQELVLFPSFSTVLEKCMVLLRRGSNLKNRIYTQRFANLATLFSVQQDLPLDEIALRQIWVDRECYKLVTWLRVNVPASAPIFINFGREMVANELKLYFSSSKFGAFKCRVCRSMVVSELSREATEKNTKPRRPPVLLLHAIRNGTALRRVPFRALEKRPVLQPSNAFVMDRETEIALQKLPVIVQRSHLKQANHSPASTSNRHDHHRGWSIAAKAVRDAPAVPYVVKESHALFTIVHNATDDGFVMVQSANSGDRGAFYEQKVQDILAMGFLNLEAIRVALSAESGNVGRAVECLLR